MLWATPGWLPEEIGIIVDQGQFFCYEGEDLKLHLQRGIHNIRVYSLIGLSVNIEGTQPQKPHLVGMINGKCLHLISRLPVASLKGAPGCVVTLLMPS
jgi:PAB-dependent poly(A)-specific ribonuclease subunit 2